ncbi:RING finger domain protein [Beauveria bassiana ARSEF 2860]|uniref:RING finger domain protein n=1 Tax=Beauveria bassiana (strain ARSEF 2860) TaxID=655819 RepID=J5JE28_BEAB2|nr:RING finger domain protein [Beauveria bassiana ARSEF 2860]EJP62001.1 RING finger domain protein [Beauveria bassiana ARSEF 2860]
MTTTLAYQGLAYAAFLMTTFTTLFKLPTRTMEGVQGADITIVSNKSQSQNPDSTTPAFPAIFFGVVFAIPCVILSAQYCFRYAHNRTRATVVNGRPTPLVTMPNARRERRQKSLMTVNEINGRFPKRKYGHWVSERAGECLPTADSFTVTTVVATIEQEGQVDAHHKLESEPLEAERQAEAPRASSSPLRGSSGYGFSNGGHPGAVGLPERTSEPGDICAICIDLFQNENYIRGLVCGHVFHVVCIDTWLTSRRACCPLCKVAQNMPIPRDAGRRSSAAANSSNLSEHSNNRISHHIRPQPACLRDNNLGSFCRASLRQIGATGHDQ